jgi:hypothetical protein
VYVCVCVCRCVFTDANRIGIYDAIIHKQLFDKTVNIMLSDACSRTESAGLGGKRGGSAAMTKGRGPDGRDRFWAPCREILCVYIYIKRTDRGRLKIHQLPCANSRGRIVRYYKCSAPLLTSEVPPIRGVYGIHVDYIRYGSCSAPWRSSAFSFHRSTKKIFFFLIIYTIIIFVSM